MGERVEPMQRIVARHRQNSGERNEEPGDPDSPGRSSRVVVQGSRLASARTLSPDFFCQTHILGHIHVG